MNEERRRVLELVEAVQKVCSGKDPRTIVGALMTTMIETAAESGIPHPSLETMLRDGFRDYWRWAMNAAKRLDERGIAEMVERLSRVEIALPEDAQRLVGRVVDVLNEVSMRPLDVFRGLLRVLTTVAHMVGVPWDTLQLWAAGEYENTKQLKAAATPTTTARPRLDDES